MVSQSSARLRKAQVPSHVVRKDGLASNTNKQIPSRLHCFTLFLPPMALLSVPAVPSVTGSYVFPRSLWRPSTWLMDFLAVSLESSSVRAA